MIIIALVKSKELESGIILGDAYCKILSVECSKISMSFTLGVYKDKESRVANKSVVLFEYYSCSHSIEQGSENSIKQAYEFLKTTEGYKDALDDLEI